MRLLHLALASRERAILRAGLAGARTTLLVETPAGRATLRRAVFAMPFVRDFSASHQWLRELRRGHDERMVAVHFRVPDDEPVYVGRFGDPHRVLAATEAARWAMEHPAGAQIVVPRSVPRRDVLSVRHVRQLVGWTRTPEHPRGSGCVCIACLPRGSRDVMRRVRAAFAAGLLAARRATTEEGVVNGLATLETAVERGRHRLDPRPLLGHAASPHPRVRSVAASLLRFFPRDEVEGALHSLVVDSDDQVVEEAVGSLVSLLGLVAAARRLHPISERVAASLLLHAEVEGDDAAAAAALAMLANHASADVRESAVRLRAELGGLSD